MIYAPTVKLQELARGLWRREDLRKALRERLLDLPIELVLVERALA